MADMKTIEKTVDEIRSLKAMRDELKKELEQLEDVVKGHMKENELTELYGNNFKVTYKETFKPYLDKQALMKKLSEDYPLYEKRTYFPTLKIL